MVLLLLGIAVGCTSKDKEGNLASEDVTTEANENDQQADEDTPKPGNPKLPITTEPITVKIWAITGADLVKVAPNRGDTEFHKELEKRTGVHVEFIHPPIGQEMENLNLMFSSGEYPDIIEFVASYEYPGGFDRGIKDGVILRVNELVDKYAPNYKALLDSDPTLRKDIITDEGNIPGFYQICSTYGNSWYGPVIRQDWLEDLGLQTPVTYDDWYNVLKAFKEKKGAAAPLMLDNTGFQPFDVLNAGYGVGQSFYQVDGNVKYGPLEPGYKEYLQMLNKWYKEGLIDPDFAAKKDFLPSDTFVATGKAGIWFDATTRLGVLKMLAKDSNYKLAALPYPVKKAGDKLGLLGLGTRATYCWALTSACKNVDTVIKWIDYMYSPEGSMLVSYGVENKTYTIGSDGKPKFADLILKNPDGLNLQQALYMYTGNIGGGRLLLNENREEQGYDPEALKAVEIWNNSRGDGSNALPDSAKLTAEEGTEFSKVMADIETYVRETTLKLILGEESFANYDAFVNNIKSMGIDRAIELKQASLDRYNRR